MDDGSNPLLRILLFLFFIVFNIIIYGFSAALQNINQIKLQKQADDGSDKAKKIIAMVDNPVKFINTVQVMSTLMSMLIGVYELRVVVRLLSKWSAGFLGDIVSNQLFEIAVYLVGAFIIIFILLSVGVMLPKKLGAKNPEKWTFSLISIVSVIVMIFTPATCIISAISNVVLKLFGIDAKDDIDNVTEEDIVSVVNEGHEQGVLLESEAAMITNIVEFGDKEAKDIMTHRKHLVAVDGDWTLNQTIRFILDSNKSRFPVYIGDIDNIVGVLHLKDAVKSYEKVHLKNKKIKDIPNVFRKTLFIPETRKINVLFKNMQSEMIHMVVVLDEYGQTSGIVAMEDILEEIVGNILDEYDEEENNIIRQSDNSYLVKGMTSLHDLEKELGIQFNEDEYDTLNGFLITKLDRIPADDERTEIVTEKCRYKILGVENKMISLVQIHIIEKNKSDEKENKNGFQLTN